MLILLDHEHNSVTHALQELLGRPVGVAVPRELGLTMQEMLAVGESVYRGHGVLSAICLWHQYLPQLQSKVSLAPNMQCVCVCLEQCKRKKRLCCQASYEGKPGVDPCFPILPLA